MDWLEESYTLSLEEIQHVPTAKEILQAVPCLKLNLWIGLILMGWEWEKRFTYGENEIYRLYSRLPDGTKKYHVWVNSAEVGIAVLSVPDFCQDATAAMQAVDQFLSTGEWYFDLAFLKQEAIRWEATLSRWDDDENFFVASDKAREMAICKAVLFAKLFKSEEEIRIALEGQVHKDEGE